MELVCIPPIGLDIHLEGFTHGETALLHVWATPIKTLKKNRSIPVTASWCDAANRCVTAKGNIQLKNFKLEKKASGVFDIELDDGHTEKGAFIVVRRQQQKPFLCE
jgi:hypothetical protein